MGGKVSLSCKGKTLLGIVNKLFVFKRLLATPSNVLPLHLKETFPPIIWIFTEGESDGIKSRLPFKIFSISCSMYWYIFSFNPVWIADYIFLLFIYQCADGADNFPACDQCAAEHWIIRWIFDLPDCEGMKFKFFRQSHFFRALSW